jgi:hypothetical protein
MRRLFFILSIISILGLAGCKMGGALTIYGAQTTDEPTALDGVQQQAEVFRSLGDMGEYFDLAALDPYMAASASISAEDVGKSLSADIAELHIKAAISGGDDMIAGIATGFRTLRGLSLSLSESVDLSLYLYKTQFDGGAFSLPDGPGGEISGSVEGDLGDYLLGETDAALAIRMFMDEYDSDLYEVVGDTSVTFGMENDGSITYITLPAGRFVVRPGVDDTPTRAFMYNFAGGNAVMLLTKIMFILGDEPNDTTAYGYIVVLDTSSGLSPVFVGIYKWYLDGNTAVMDMAGEIDIDGTIPFTSHIEATSSRLTLYGSSTFGGDTTMTVKVVSNVDGDIVSAQEISASSVDLMTWNELFAEADDNTGGYEVFEPLRAYDLAKLVADGSLTNEEMFNAFTTVGDGHDAWDGDTTRDDLKSFSESTVLGKMEDFSDTISQYDLGGDDDSGGGESLGPPDPTASINCADDINGKTFLYHHVVDEDTMSSSDLSTYFADDGLLSADGGLELTFTCSAGADSVDLVAADEDTSNFFGVLCDLGYESFEGDIAYLEKLDSCAPGINDSLKDAELTGTVYFDMRFQKDRGESGSDSEIARLYLYNWYVDVDGHATNEQQRYVQFETE